MDESCFPLSSSRWLSGSGNYRKSPHKTNKTRTKAFNKEIVSHSEQSVKRERRRWMNPVPIQYLFFFLLFFLKSRQRAKTKFSDPEDPNDIILTFHWTLKTFPLQQGGRRESSRIEQVSWTNMPWNRKWPSIDFVCVQKDQFYSSFVFRLQCTKASASSRMCFLQTWSKWSYKSSVGAEST